MKRPWETINKSTVGIGKLIFIVLLVTGVACTRTPEDKTPVNFKVAFIGDQGLGEAPRAVLELIRSEGTQAVVHLGDIDYEDDPAAWDAMINDVLGSDFPYFTCIGNHDKKMWSGPGGYQQYIKDRFTRLGIAWNGDLGVKSSFKYKGLFIMLLAPGELDSNHAEYIKAKLVEDPSIWSICGWHKNMTDMQLGHKSDDTGWGVYEESRKGGAIIATAHEHSYQRTHLLSDVMNKTVASRSDTLVIDKGHSFVFVSGLGGKSIRDQERTGDWWASAYTSDQNANYGALFGEFNVNGQANLARFYFKDIDGVVADSFWIQSRVEPER
ncbi:MAG: metallophosphoesterase [Candidatus Neomarinimicrobiota bacterium]